MGEEAASRDRVMRTPELEEKDLTGLKRGERPGSARLPEIHLVETMLFRQELVPAPISDSHPSLHRSHSDARARLVLFARCLSVCS
jgi:hypothetical protein